MRGGGGLIKQTTIRIWLLFDRWEPLRRVRSRGTMEVVRHGQILDRFGGGIALS